MTGDAKMYAAHAGRVGPYEQLSGAYETLLRYRPVIASGRFRLVPWRGRRRATGSFYTPLPIVRRVVRAALAATPLAHPVILDPAMGTGVFLVEAVRALVARGHSAAAVAETLIYGIDLDPAAVRLATLVLWLETGANPAVLASRLVCGDALAVDLPASDIVTGNPPWGILAEGVDSFKRFARRAAETARTTVALVLPHAVLAQTSHVDVRRALLARHEPYGALDLGDGWFDQATAPACALLFGRRPGPARIAVTSGHPGTPVRHRTVARSRWSEAGFPLSDESGLDLMHHLQGSLPTLGALSDLFRIHDSGINYGRAEIARQALYDAEVAEDPRDLPRYRGRCFHRYTSVRRGGWLRHDWDSGGRAGDGLAYDRSLRLIPEKIVVRQTADRIIATVDRSGMVMGRSVIAITAADRTALLALLACLNSSLLLVLYRALAGEEGRILPQLKVARLRSLPVPGACLAASPGWRTLASLGEAMLAAEGRNEELDRAIDAQVEALYEVGGSYDARCFARRRSSWDASTL